MARESMNSKPGVDAKTRLNIAANMRRLRWEHRFDSDAEMAKKCGLSRSAINRALKGERTVGLDVLLAVSRALGANLQWLVDAPQDPRWLNPDFKPTRR